MNDMKKLMIGWGGGDGCLSVLALCVLALLVCAKGGRDE